MKDALKRLAQPLAERLLKRMTGRGASDTSGRSPTADNDLTARVAIRPPAKRFGFLVHEPVMLAHYRDVWAALGSSRFVIVLTDNFAVDDRGNEKLGAQAFLAHARSHGYEVRTVSEVIRSQVTYEYVVSNHCISRISTTIPDQVAYLPQALGRKQIRFMYGADISVGWSLADWNNIYDVFLCHGVNDEREIKKRFTGKTFVMGYPRYDRFFSTSLDVTGIVKEFGLSSDKKTLLWMPTLGGEYSSIPRYCRPLARLRQFVNIIVRPHPISFVQERTFIEMLRELNFTIDESATRDMNELFAVADVVLADNGGTPFSAIFLGKCLVFLDVPEDLGARSANSFHIAGSSVMELKRHLPVLKPDQIDELVNLVNSADFMEDNRRSTDLLFKQYFDSPRGGGARRVVEIFDSLA